MSNVDLLPWISPSGRPFAELLQATFFAGACPASEDARPGDVIRVHLDVDGRRYVASFNPTSRGHFRIRRNGRTVSAARLARIGDNKASAADADSCSAFLNDVVRFTSTTTPRKFINSIMMHTPWLNADQKKRVRKNAYQLDEWWSAVASIPFSLATNPPTDDGAEASA